LKIAPGIVTAKLMPKLRMKENVPVIFFGKSSLCSGEETADYIPELAPSSAWNRTQAVIEECSFRRVKGPRPMTMKENPIRQRGLYLPNNCKIFPPIAANVMRIRTVERSGTPDLAGEEPSTAWK
jgi:hypothetical protein